MVENLFFFAQTCKTGFSNRFSVRKEELSRTGRQCGVVQSGAMRFFESILLSASVKSQYQVRWIRAGCCFTAL